MDWAEALAAIQSSDLSNKADIIAAVKKQVSTVIGEKNTVSDKLRETESTIAAIVEGTKATGESVADKLKDAAAKIAALNAASTAKDTQIAELTTKYTALESEKTALLSKATLQDLAAKMKANPTVLGTLIPDVSKVVMDGDKVTVDGKSWDDWLKLDTIAPFVPALVTTGTSGNPTGKQEPKLPTLPTGKADGGGGNVKSIYEAVRRKPWTPPSAS
jgi:hypothetical protein